MLGIISLTVVILVVVIVIIVVIVKRRKKEGTETVGNLEKAGSYGSVLSNGSSTRSLHFVSRALNADYS